AYGDPFAVLREAAPSLAEPDAALRWLRQVAPSRFFAGVAAPDTLSMLQHRLPGACAHLVAGATRTVVERRFDLLGYRGLSFGDPIDWHLDPVWKRRAPLMHWSRIDPLDAATVGDSKVVWELNRHQWIVQLAQAWALTADERYGEAAVAS